MFLSPVFRPALGVLVRVLPGLCFASAAALAQVPSVLPPEVDAALAKARVPREAVAMVVLDTTTRAASRLEYHGNTPMNAASVMKLVTTFGALELLGPAYTWGTRVLVEGAIREGTLHGNLVIKGSGDPALVVERLWLLMRRIQGLGIQRITGDIVLDRSAFTGPEIDPGSFDGEPLRPYNAAPDALLLNFKSIVMNFVPDAAAGVAHVQVEPPMAGVEFPASVPLSAGADCGDYRATLRPDFTDPLRIRFEGSYPAVCQEKLWPIAYADPRNYAPRAIAGMWQSVGGKLDGTVREGKAAPTATRATRPGISIETRSPPLAEIIRDINKYSNNVMAQQVFLTLGVQQPGIQTRGGPLLNTPEAARAALLRWWQERFGNTDVPQLDNGSGLSREGRISGMALARLLQAAYGSALMPEFMASLPVAGVDGTMRSNRSRAAGAAHLKTGTLRDVSAMAGYVLAASGKRYVVVALINHANAPLAARPAFDALLDWAVRDQ